MNKSNLVPRIFIIGIFILGNSIINLPFAKYGSNSLPGFIIATLIFFPIFIVFDKTNLSEKIMCKKVFSILYSLFCLFNGLICTRNFITFSDKVILPEINSFFPILLFLFVVIFLCLSEKNVIIKTAFVSGFIMLFLMLFLLVASLKNMSLSNLLLKNDLSLKGIVYESLSYICLSYIPSIALVGFFDNLKSDSHKVFIKGYFLGVIFLLVSFMQSILVMGYGVTSSILHPYASGISIITLGNNYSRLEGFSYFIYFASSLIKTAICVYVSETYFTCVFKKAKKYFLPVVCIIYGGISLFVSAFKNTEFLKITPYIILPFFILLTFLLRSKKTVKE